MTSARDNPRGPLRKRSGVLLLAAIAGGSVSGWLAHRAGIPVAVGAAVGAVVGTLTIVLLQRYRLL